MNIGPTGRQRFSHGCQETPAVAAYKALYESLVCEVVEPSALTVALTCCIYQREVARLACLEKSLLKR